MSEHFAQPRPFGVGGGGGGDVEVELDLFNYATKAALENATGVDTLKLAKKVDSASLKSEIGKLDISKLETTPVHLSKLSDVDELLEKVNAMQTTDTSNLVKKTDCNTNISETEKKTLDHDHDKHITTQECNNLAAENFAARLKQANLATKSDIADFVEETDFDEIKLK